MLELFDKMGVNKIVLSLIMLKNDQNNRRDEGGRLVTLQNEQSPTNVKKSKRDAIKLLAQKKVRNMQQSRSDNNHQRKTIADKQLRSLRRIPPEEVKDFEDYEINPKARHFEQSPENSNYNKCLRDDPEIQTQILSIPKPQGTRTHRKQQIESRAKPTSRDANRDSSKNINTSVKFESQNKKSEKNLLPHQISIASEERSTNSFKKSSDSQQQLSDYGFEPRNLHKSSSSSGFHRAKKQKCSTLKLTKQSSLSRNSSLSKKYLSSKPVQPAFEQISDSSDPNRLKKINNDYALVIKRTKKTSEKSSSKFVAKESGLRKQGSSKRLSKNSQTGSRGTLQQILPSIQEKESINPLVLQEKHLFTEYGLKNEYSSKPNSKELKSQKEIGLETENVSRQVSKQMLISRKQTQKLISRARQKNKKIIGKLKEKRSAIRNSLNNNGSRFSSSFAAFRVSSHLQKSGAHRNFGKGTGDQFGNSQIPKHLNESRHGSGHASFCESEEMFLPTGSHLNSPSVICFNGEIKQKIQLHIQTLSILGDYCESFNSIYQDCSEWEELIFLLYKKYFIQREKVYKLLKFGRIVWQDNSESQELPFVFPFSEMDGAELAVFRESKESVGIELGLETDNSAVKAALRDLYNQCIQKSADNGQINMYEVDDFAEDIVEDLNEEINMLMESCGKSQKIKTRINQAIQVGMMVAHLEGYYFEEIEDVIMGDVSSKDFFHEYYPRFMQIFEEEM